jgi:hypothetical protein
MSKEMQEIMFAHVRAWQREKMTMKAFAQSIGVTKNKFEYWYRKYKRINTTPKTLTEFIELQPPQQTNKTFEAEKQDQASLPTLKFELSLPDGLSLKIYS